MPEQSFFCISSSLILAKEDLLPLAGGDSAAPAAAAAAGAVRVATDGAARPRRRRRRGRGRRGWASVVAADAAAAAELDATFSGRCHFGPSLSAPRAFVCRSPPLLTFFVQSDIDRWRWLAGRWGGSQRRPWAELLHGPKIHRGVVGDFSSFSVGEVWCLRITRFCAVAPRTTTARRSTRAKTLRGVAVSLAVRRKLFRGVWSYCG